jgi:hypothetical protein
VNRRTTNLLTAEVGDYAKSGRFYRAGSNDPMLIMRSLSWAKINPFSSIFPMARTAPPAVFSSAAVSRAKTQILYDNRSISLVRCQFAMVGQRGFGMNGVIDSRNRGNGLSSSGGVRVADETVRVGIPVIILPGSVHVARDRELVPRGNLEVSSS